MTTGEKLYTLTLDSGVPVYVRPLSPIAQTAILDALNERYPDPDKALYEKPAPNAPPGVVIMMPADENEDYIKARRVALVSRMNAFNDAVIRAGVVCDSPLGQQRLIDHYAPLRALLLAITPIEADVWQQTVMLCLIRTRSDAITIVNAAIETLTESEVRNGIKSFRRDLQWSGVDGNFGEQGASGTPGAPYG